MPVLACCIIDKKTYLGLLQLGLHAKMFTDKMQRIFQAVVAYRSEMDIGTILINNLKVEGVTLSELNEITDSIYENAYGSTALYPQYFEALKDEYIEREFRGIVKSHKQINTASLGEMAEEIIALTNDSYHESFNMKETINEAINEIERRYSDEYENPYRLGLHDYDRLGHFERGSLMVLGGESGHGKSMLALNMAYRWIRKGMKVVYFSYEMSRMITVAKLTLIHTNLEWDKTFVTKGEKLTPEEFGRLIDGFQWFLDKPIIINTKATTLPEMEVIIRNFRADVFILDTINALIRHEDRTDIALGDIARSFKRIAESMNSLGVIIAQLKDITGRPSDKNLVKESRQIRDIADYMDFVYREEEKNFHLCNEMLKGVMEIFRVKGRLTGVGKEYLGFNKRTGVVENLSEYKLSELKTHFQTRRR